MGYKPPFTLTDASIHLMMDISEKVGSISTIDPKMIPLKLKRANRIRSINSSLAIEGSDSTYQMVSDAVDGKRVIGPMHEIIEVKNAVAAYELIDSLDPGSLNDLLKAHKAMMIGLVDHPGEFRTTGEGVFDSDGRCIHLAPPADPVPSQMSDLLLWLRTSDTHDLIKSCVFHYELEFIHPFEDGNGRTGRLWQTLILTKWNRMFKWIPLESVIYEHQQEYYRAIAESDRDGESTKFIEFMLKAIYDALTGFDTDRKMTSDLTDIEQKVLELIISGDYRTAANAADILKTSAPTINRATQSLSEKGLIQREGSRKTGAWRLIK